MDVTATGWKIKTKKRNIDFVFLLYADDSGVTSDPDVKYSVLAGFATFENQTYWIQKAVDDIMLKYIGRADLELHVSPIRSGRGIWRSFPKENRGLERSSHR